MLQLNLIGKLLSCGISTPHSWLTKTLKCSKGKAHKLLSGKAKCVNPKDLSRICIALECNVNDLFIWKVNTSDKFTQSNEMIKELQQKATA